MIAIFWIQYGLLASFSFRWTFPFFNSFYFGTCTNLFSFCCCSFHSQFPSSKNVLFPFSFSFSFFFLKIYLFACKSYTVDGSVFGADKCGWVIRWAAYVCSVSLDHSIFFFIFHAYNFFSPYFAFQCANRFRKLVELFNSIQFSSG